MSTDPFPIPALGWMASRLGVLELPELQALFERAADFYQLTEGRPPLPDAAQEEWEALAPGRSRGDKRFWALRDAEGRLHGCLEATEGYPGPSTCWLGLLLLDPVQRRKGAGRAVVRAFAAWARSRGAAEIQLAVVEANRSARLFWEAQGFLPLRVARDRVIGLRTHPLHVLRLPLA